MSRLYYFIFIIGLQFSIQADEVLNECQAPFSRRSYPGEALKNVTSESMQEANYTAYSSKAFSIVYDKKPYWVYLISEDSKISFRQFELVFSRLNKLGLANHVLGYIKKDNLLDFRKDPVFHFVAKEVSFAVLYDYYPNTIYSHEVGATKLAKNLSPFARKKARAELIKIVSTLNKNNLFTSYFEYQVNRAGKVYIHEIELFQFNSKENISIEEVLEHFDHTFVGN